MKKENNNSIKNIAIIALIAAVVILIIGFLTRPKDNTPGNNRKENDTVKEEFVQVLDDGTKINISTKLNQMKELDGLSIGNIQYTYSNGISTVLADVTNNSSKATDLTDVKLILLDKDGKVMAELEGLIGPLQPGASTKLNMGITLDLVNAYDFRIEKM